MLAARGDIFAFTDSDSVWARDAIEKIVPIFNHDPEVGAVSGHCRALNANSTLLTRIQDTWYEGQFSIRKACESVFGAVTCVSGPLAVFRREAVYTTFRPGLMTSS
jgi:cellulose synthase/poly-beta-1,6-N-acetylglucosamine synthase-like glycosyltransferase